MLKFLLKKKKNPEHNKQVELLKVHNIKADKKFAFEDALQLMG